MVKYYGLLNRYTGQLTDIMITPNKPKEKPGCDIVELDMEPDFPIGTPLTYDADKKAAIPHKELIQKQEKERAAQLKLEASPEWREISDTTVEIIQDGSNEERVFPDRILPELFLRVQKLVLRDVPSEKILKKLVTVAYFSSFSKEESKSYPFIIAFLSAIDDVAIQPGWLPIVFDSPRPFNVSEVTKLAPSLDFSQTILCVKQGPSDLEIWAIVILSRSVSKYKEGSKPGFSYMIPNYLKIEVPRPGNLIFEVALERLLEYRLGEIIMNPIPVFQEDGPVLRFLQSYKWFDGESILRPVGLLIQRVLKLGHGGIILLVPREKIPEAERLLKIKYHLLNERLDYFCKLGWTFEGHIQSWGLSNIRPSWANDTLRSYALTERNAYIEEIVDAYAHLARIDGALILTTELNVIGFGAQIQGDPIEKAYRSLNSLSSKIEEYDLKKFGTRHNAAARFAYGIEGTLVSVVSEDGIPSFFMRKKDKLIIWRPVGIEFAFRLGIQE